VGVYGAAKAWGEALGRDYSDRHGISILCIRFGRVTKDNRPGSVAEAARFLSHRDAAQIVERCVDAPGSVRFDIFYAVSNNATRYRDIGHPKAVIGYEPQDGVPSWPLPQGWNAA
jgi:nucleoside-diphosphate-sugar epimerase